MTTPDSPDDRRARKETLDAIVRKVAVVLVLYAIAGTLVASLGVPWPIVVAFGVVVVLFVIFFG
jgi:hypothetical protein